MNQLATLNFSNSQLSLIRHTVAKDCNDTEFDLFIHICKHVRLDPLKRQIYALVFHKSDPKKRQMVIVTAIDGYRTIADRTCNYRPDSAAPRFEMGEKEATNPTGLLSATVTVYKFAHDEWHPVTASAYWDEYVPLFNGEIDRKKTGWVKMPRVMLAKCAEAQALRKAWPDDLGNVYTIEEVDREQSLDLSATEQVAKADTEKKLALIGGKHAIMTDWCDGSPLERIPDGKYADRVMAWAKSDGRCASELESWWHRNKDSRAEFKARNGADYLQFHKEFEGLLNHLEAMDAEPAMAAAE